MPFWKRKESPPNESPGAPTTEQAVLIKITSLRDADAGLDCVEGPLIEAIERSGVGEFDGNDVGPDGATLYLYGSDADEIWAAVDGAVDRSALGPGSHAIVRYGPPTSPVRRIDLA